jgi:hypothetical protein
MTTRRQDCDDKAIERYESLEPWLFRVMTSLALAETPGTRPSQIHLDAVFEDRRGRHLHVTFGGVQDFSCEGWSGVIADPLVIVLNDDPDFFAPRYRVYSDRGGPITFGCESVVARLRRATRSAPRVAVLPERPAADIRLGTEATSSASLPTDSAADASVA